MHQETAAENMTKALRTVSFDAPVEEAYRLMEEANVRHLPVTDQNGLVVGILAERDVYRAMNPRRPGFAEGLSVGDFMTWPAISVRETTPVADVVRAMLVEKVNAFLVTDEHERPVGIVTSEDMLHLLERILHEHASGAEGSWATLGYQPVVREALRELTSLGI